MSYADSRPSTPMNFPKLSSEIFLASRKVASIVSTFRNRSKRQKNHSEENRKFYIVLRGCSVLEKSNCRLEI